MKISEFIKQHPSLAIDFAVPVRNQPRIFEGAILDQFPIELEPEHPYHSGSRGRPNLNQTLAHSQCATCQRVLRNDFFYTPPSLMRRNVVFSHCRECTQQLNASHYEARAELIQERRAVIWQFLAPRCALCGFDQHLSAMDLHHPDRKEAQVAELITQVTLSLNAGRVEALLREAAKCTPLCSNCHRMVHAGVISLPAPTKKPAYKIADLMVALKNPK